MKLPFKFLRALEWDVAKVELGFQLTGPMTTTDEKLQPITVTRSVLVTAKGVFECSRDGKNAPAALICTGSESFERLSRLYELAAVKPS